ncbi:DUF1206 domain-containing protein [Flavihumibacter sp. R14]|nr:DUF1206 domain-containing protein [Flavihumibacter soli]
MLSTGVITSHEKPFAQAGLMAKGTVYCILGILAFMAAFHIDGQSVNKADKAGVFDFINKQPGGQALLAVVAVGLFSYCLWRGIQAFMDTANKGTDGSGIATRLRYLFSGIVYGSLGVYAVKMLLSKNTMSGDKQQGIAQELLSRPFGQWLAGIAAAILAGVGIYQLYYGLSEKYKKHVQKAAGSSNRNLLLTAGKVGYIARGTVWLIIAWMFSKAALHSNSAEAGDTSRAFGFLQDVAYGRYVLAAVGLGLICYGTFNFIRARFERFH